MDEARSEQDVIEAAIEKLRGYGATMILAWLLPTPNAGGIQFTHRIIHAWPPEWTARYVEQQLEKHDPVLRLLRQGRTGIVWHEMTEEEVGDEHGRRVMAGAASVGMHDGYTTLMSTLDGQMFVFTMAGERIEVSALDKLAMATVAQHAVGAILRLRHISRKAAAAKLTRREREAIQIAADGGKSEEIAIAMGISLRGAEKHLANGRRKLSARNTNDAIAQAIRLGIIR